MASEHQHETNLEEPSLRNSGGGDTVTTTTTTTTTTTATTDKSHTAACHTTNCTTTGITSSKVDDVASADRPSNSSSTDEGPRIITELGPNDVLLGRGAPIINYMGNVKFRTLVRSRKTEYMTSARHKMKDEVAKRIMKEIERRGGRFVKRIETKNDSSNDASQKVIKLYQLADYEIALEKVKQALRDKDPENVQRSRRDDKTADPQPPLGLEEAAALSGISTLTSLHQQQYELHNKISRNNSEGSSTACHFSGLANASTNSDSHNFLPSSAASINHGICSSGEQMRYQQMQSLPNKVQERLANEGRINMFNQELERRQQQQDQQLFLSLLRQSSNSSSYNGNMGSNLESFQQPISPRTMLSLIQQSNNSLLNNMSGSLSGVSNIGSSHNINEVLQRNQQELLLSNGNINSILNGRMNQTSEHDSLSQQLSSRNNEWKTRNQFCGNNVSQVASNFRTLQRQEQLDQCNTAILAYSALFNGTAAATGSSNLELDRDVSIPGVSKLNDNLFGSPTLNDSIGLMRSSSGRQVPASSTLHSLIQGKMGEQERTLDVSNDRNDNTITKKRKCSNDGSDKSSQKSSSG